MTDTYKRAYTEVLEIIKYLPNEEYSKIPESKIRFYEENMDKNYNFKINPEIDLSNQNISKEANSILVLLFKEYFASEKQKKVLNELLNQNQKKQEENKYEKYNPNDIFKNRQTDVTKLKVNSLNDNDKNNKTIKENTKMIKYNQKKWYQVLFEKIKKIFA